MSRPPLLYTYPVEYRGLSSPIPTPAAPEIVRRQSSTPSTTSYGTFATAGPRKTSTVSTPASYVNLSLSSSGLGLNLFDHLNEATSDDLLLVSEKVTEWQNLLRNLFSPNDVSNLIDQLECDGYNKGLQVKDLCHRALCEWKRRKASQASFQRLLDSLEKIGRRDVKEELEKERLNNSFPVFYHSRSHGPNHSLHSSAMSSYSSLGSYMQQMRFEQNFGRGEENPDLLSPDDEDDGGLMMGSESTKVPHEQRPSEVDLLVATLNNREQCVISLAGPPESGKTVTLNILEQELCGKQGYEKTKIIKIHSGKREDCNWLTRAIVQEITKQPRPETDQTKYAIRHLKGLLDTDSYDEVLLIIDVSLNPWTERGRNILEFVLTLRLNGKLNGKLSVVISCVGSLSKTSLFLQNRHSSKEVKMEPMTYNSAFEFLIQVNPSFSKRAAAYIVQRIECYPVFLNKVAKADLEGLFVVDSKEELLSALECRFDAFLETFKGDNGDEAVEEVFNCLDRRDQEILTQILPFKEEFNIEQAIRVVDSKVSVNESSFNALCEQGALFLTREMKTAKHITYTIPTILGDRLRNIVLKDDRLRQMYNRAVERHQKMYLELVVLLSNCFMGDLPDRFEEVRVLEPFTPSDGVPENLSILTDDLSERVGRVAMHFRRHCEDIKQSLVVCSSSKESYEAAISIATRVNVYHFLTKMLRLHESREIYRQLKRRADRKEHIARLNAIIASLSIDAHGHKRYSSESMSLYEAAHVILEKEFKESAEPWQHHEDKGGDSGDMYALCLRGLGVSSLAKGLQIARDTAEEDDEDFSQRSSNIRLSNDILNESLSKRVDRMVRVGDNLRILAAFLDPPFQHSVMGMVDPGTTIEGAVRRFQEIDLRKSIVGAQEEYGYTEKSKRTLEDQHCAPCLAECLGTRHPLTSNGRFIQSTILRKNKEFDAAKIILHEVLDAQEELLGEHGDTARTLVELALCVYEEFLDKFCPEIEEKTPKAVRMVAQAEVQHLPAEHQKKPPPSQLHALISTGSSVPQQPDKWGLPLVDSVSAERDAFQQGDSNVRHRSASVGSKPYRSGTSEFEMQCTCEIRCKGVCLHSRIRSVTTEDLSAKNQLSAEKLGSPLVSFSEVVVSHLPPPAVAQDLDAVSLDVDKQILFKRLYSSSSNSLYDMSSQPDSASTGIRIPQAALQGSTIMTCGTAEEKAKLLKVKHWLRTAARYLLHAVGICEDAREIFIFLAKVCAHLGEGENEERYIHKANRCGKSL